MILALESAPACDLPVGIDTRRIDELPTRGAVNKIVQIQDSGRFRPEESATSGEEECGVAYHLVSNVHPSGSAVRMTEESAQV
jgi:hypothetical protein